MRLKQEMKNRFFKPYIWYARKKYFADIDREEFGRRVRELKRPEVKPPASLETIYIKSENEPLISVITPAYRAAPFLKELCRSLEEQEIADKIQWVAVDDCSPDNTAEVLREIGYSTSLKSVKFLKLSTNQGTGLALNAAAENADAPILAWLSADDMYCDRKKLSTDLEMIRSGFDCVFSRFTVQGPTLTDSIIDDCLSYVKKEYYNSQLKNLHLLLRVMMGGHLFNGSSAVFKKEVFFRVGKFDDFFNLFEQDQDMWMKLLLSRANIGFSNTYSFYRNHPYQFSKRIYDLHIFMNLSRIRILKFILENRLNKYVEYFKIKILEKPGEYLLIFPFSAYYFINQIDELSCNPMCIYFKEKFLYWKFGRKNIELLFLKSRYYENSKNFTKFKEFFDENLLHKNSVIQ